MKKAFHVQSIELASSAPHVISHRLGQLSSATFSPSAADYQEFCLMWTEKVFGLGESLLATTVETVRLQQKLLISTSEYWMAPWLLPQAMMETSFTHAPVAGERLLRKAMAPIHGKVVANAERLGRK